MAFDLLKTYGITGTLLSTTTLTTTILQNGEYIPRVCPDEQVLNCHHF